MKKLALLREKIVYCALGFEGQKEIKNNQGFLTAWVDTAMRNAGFQNGYAWCMITVEAIYKSAIALYFQSSGEMLTDLLKEVKELITPSTQQTYNNFVEKSKYFTVLSARQADYSKLRSGDIVIFLNSKNRAYGHAGVIIEVYEDHFVTIEGNTNNSGSPEGDGVYKKNRTIEFDGKGLDIRGFIQMKDF